MIGVPPRLVGSGAVATALALALVVCDPPASAQVHDPAGLYYMGSENLAVAQEMIDHPELAGISIRFTWEGLEPTQGALDTSLLEDEIARAKAAGKKVLLRVRPGSATPQWVFDAGVASIRFPEFLPTGDPTGEHIRVPVPWDPTYLQLWGSLISRLGSRVGDDDAVVLIQLTGANSASGEISLEQRSSIDDETAEYIDGDGQVIATGRVRELWLDPGGYSQEVITAAWAGFRDAWGDAFPNAKLSLNLLDQVLSEDGVGREVEGIVADLVESTPDRMALQNNSLADRGDMTEQMGQLSFMLIEQYGTSVTTGFQYGPSIVKCTNPQIHGDLGPALAFGMYFGGADYFELYEPGIETFPTVVAECSDFLAGSAPSCGSIGEFICNLDTEPPSASITLPLPGTVVTGAFAIEAQAMDNVLTFEVVTEVDGVESGRGLVSYPLAGGFRADVDLPLLPGDNTVTLKALDVSGNQGFASVQVTHGDPPPAGSCAPHVWIADQTVATNVVWEACDTMIVGRGLETVGSPSITLRAGSSVILWEGFSFGGNGSLAIETEPVASPATR